MTVPSEFALLHYGKEIAMLANMILYREPETFIHYLVNI